MTVRPANPKVQANKQLRVIHWVMAAVFAVLLSGGIYMSELPKEAAFRGDFYNFHKSLGVLVMALLLVRIVVLLRAALPPRLPKQPITLLKTVGLYTLLYGFMVLLPLSGYTFSNAFGRDVAFFGLELPAIVAEDKALGGLARNAHSWLAYTFIAFIALHMAVQYRYILGLISKVRGSKTNDLGMQ